MAIRSLPNIKVAGKGTSGDSGEAFGGFITSFQFDIAYGNEKSTLSMTIENESGQYADIGSFKSYLDSYRVDIEGAATVYMYLVGVEESITSSRNTVSLNFVDGSHILDRIFIGLLGEHDYSDISREKTTLEAEIPVICEGCTPQTFLDKEKVIVTPTGYKSGTKTVQDIDFENLVTRGVANPDEFAVYKSKKAVFPDKSKIVKDGGIIILGDEGFGASDCSIKTCDYSFTQLQEVLNSLNPSIETDIKSSPTSNGRAVIQQDLNRYRKSYTGTLRTVLQNWCNDFGVSFIYDCFSNTPKIKQIDLRSVKSQDRIQTIKSTAKGIQSTSSGEALVESISSSSSIEGTSKKFICSKFVNQEEFKDHQSTIYFQTLYGNIRMSDVGFASYGRTETEFLISCALAKYNRELRTLFNMSLAMGTQSLGIPRYGIFRALGFLPQVEVPTLLKQQVLNSFGREDYMQVAKLLDPTGTNNYLMAVGLYSEELDNQEYEYEKKVAETFLGKHFYTNLPEGEPRPPKCPSHDSPNKLVINSKLEPQIQKVLAGTENQQFQGPNGGSEQEGSYDFPFADIMRSPMAYNKLFSKADSNFVNIFTRNDANFYPSIDVFNSYFETFNASAVAGGSNSFGEPQGNTGKSLLEFLLPRYIDLDNTAAGFTLKSRFPYNFIGQTITTNLGQQLQPKLFLAPNAAVLNQYVRFSNIDYALNPADNGYMKDVERGADKTESCSTTSFICEKQKSLVATVCRERCDNDITKALPIGIDLEAEDNGESAENPDGKPYHQTFGASKSRFPVGIFDLSQAQNEPEANLFENRQSYGFQVFFTHPQFGLRNAYIVFPLGVGPQNSSYAANYIETAERSTFLSKLQDIKNSFSNINVGNVSKINIEVIDSSEQMNYLTFDPTLPEGQVNNLWIPGDGNFKTHDEYFNFLQWLNNQEVLPQESLSVNLAGLELGSLKPFVKITEGLQQYNISISDQGYTTKLSFQSRPNELPPKDMFSTLIGPKFTRK